MRRGSLGQAATEFALISPILLLVIFGIVDFGRAIFYDLEISQAVGEAARTASGVGADGLPTNAQVYTKMRASAPFVSLGPCPNGPLATPSPGQGYLYVTENPAPTGYEAAPSSNAPGGEHGTNGSGCNSAVAAGAGDQLRVTITYTFMPITPIISQVIGNRIQLTSASVIPVENAGGG